MIGSKVKSLFKGTRRAPLQCPRGRCFSLVELMVVVSILAILASMLLPALTRARYISRNLVCVNKLKQVGIAFTSYASDYDDLYPDYEPETPYHNGRGNPFLLKPKSLHIATRRNINGKRTYFDLRPELRQYLGQDSLNVAMTCPLASPKWFENGGKSDGRDIDNYTMGGYGAIQTTYQLFPSSSGANRDLNTSVQMRRLGDSFVPSDAGATAVDQEFRLLAADYTYVANYAMPSANGYMIVTQQPYGSGAQEGGNHTNETTGWLLPPGATTISNFLRDDGSVNSYHRVGANAVNRGEFLTTRGKWQAFVLPADAAE